MYWNNLKTIQGGAEWIGDILDQPEESQTGVPCGNLAGDITLENVNFAYTEGHPVLRDLSCTFEDGKITALLGESGCGKTTLANLLLRLYEPDQGIITIGTNTSGQYDLDSYCQQFVMVARPACCSPAPCGRTCSTATARSPMRRCGAPWSRRGRTALSEPSPAR